MLQNKYMKNQSDKHSKVLKALEEIRPYLLNDGGDISLVSIEDNVVNIKFEGACVNCAVNRMTLKSGVEMTIKKHAPSITTVIDVDAIINT